MRRGLAIAAVVLSALPAGCESMRAGWPWGSGPTGVPVTRPTSVDANAAAAMAVVEPAPGPAPREAVPPAPREAVPPAPREAIAPTSASRPAPRPPPIADNGTAEAVAALDEPTPLTDLLRPRRPSPATHPVGPIEPIRPVEVPGPAPPATRPAKGVGEGPVVSVLPGPAPAPSPGPGPEARREVTLGPSPRVIGREAIVAAPAVQVNNGFITVDDILRRLRPRLKKLPSAIADDVFGQRVGPWITEEVQAQTIRKLVLAEAEKRLTEEQKKAIETEVQQALNDMLARADGSKTRLDQMLRAEGTTLDDALSDHREEATFRLYLRGRFLPAIHITRQMLWDHYSTHLAEFTADKKVQMQLIVAPLDAFLPEGGGQPTDLEKQAARAQARQLIGKAKAELDAGREFADVARSLSRGVKAKEGGVWPMMGAGNFRETAVEEAAFRLPEGGVAGPIETEGGFYLVKARRVQPGRVVPFEEAQEDISQTLRDQQYRRLTEDYFRQLIEAAVIVRSERFLTFTLEKALELHRQQS